MIWPVLALYVSLKSPEWNWWFPTTTNSEGVADSPIGQRIDGLFYTILYVTSLVFVGTQVALGYVLWKGSRDEEDDLAEDGTPRKAWYTHGSHNLEVMWTIIPAGILLFIALYQMDVWAEYRVRDASPQQQMEKVLAELGINPLVELEVDVPARRGESHVSEANEEGDPAAVQTEGHHTAPPRKEKKLVKRLALAEVTARQFEWRIRYPGFDEQGNLLPLMPDPQPTDLYAVNDLHLPSGVPVMIELRTQDVQHSFFVPELRVKQDAVPGLVIPIWFQANKSTTYSLTCAELCGWGHYKMKARVVAQPANEFKEYLRQLQKEQFDDGFRESE